LPPHANPWRRKIRTTSQCIRGTQPWQLAAAVRRMPDLTAEQRASLELFSRALLNKFLHNPSIRLREAAANGRGLGVIDAAQYLFALDSGKAPAEDSPMGTSDE
jgi:glutamyl-tRNA reductase